MTDNLQKKKIAVGSLFLLFSLFLQLAARYVPGFGEWYGSVVYPLLVRMIGGLSSLFPFSLVEFMLYVFILFGLIYGISRIRYPIKLCSALLLVLGILAFSYTANCGINYYRQPFSHFLDLELCPSSQEELEQLCVFLAGKTAETLKELEGSSLSDKPDFPRQAKADMEKLGQVYPQLSGFYPQPKPVFVSEILSIQSLSGIYSPFTIEANYNQDMTAYNIPHTACHELSHLRGFMREDEANFIGYLACVSSDAPFSRYSGYLSGFIYAVNALYRQDASSAAEMYSLLPERAMVDLHTNNQFWKQYEGPVAEVSTQINDTYLKANNQSDGVKSYGRMVDLLLAYYHYQH